MSHYYAISQWHYTRVKSSRVWLTNTIQNTIHSLVNSHIFMPGGQFSHFWDKMSLARDTGHRGSIPGWSRPFQDGWQAYKGQACQASHFSLSRSFGTPCWFMCFHHIHCSYSSFASHVLFKLSTLQSPCIAHTGIQQSTQHTVAPSTAVCWVPAFQVILWNSHCFWKPMIGLL